MPGWTRGWFVTAILAVLLTVAHPEPRNTLLICSAATMLTSGTVGNTRLCVPCQVELIRTGTLVARSSLLNVPFDVQIRRLWRR